MNGKRPGLAGLAVVLFLLTGCMPDTTVIKPSRTAPVVINRPTGPLSVPRRVLEEAIQALGGEAILRRMRQNYCTGEGKSIILNQLQKYRFKTISALPDRSRDESSYENGLSWVQVINGSKGWISENKHVRDMDEANLKTVQEVLHVNYVMTLVPLREPTFTLEGLPEQRKDGYLCQAFTVKSKGHRDVTLFFDKETHLPVVLKTTVYDPNQAAEKDQETYFRNFKESEGLKYASRWAIYNDGTKTMELNFSDMKPLEKVEDQFFAKP